MLVPAITKKKELEEAFAKELYTERYYYYSGYAYCNSLPEIKAEDNVYQYASVDKKGNLVGYLSFRVDSLGCSVYNFGLYSFKEGNLTIIRDLFEKMEELIANYHRVEWRVVGGNHAKHGYERFCKKYNGNVLHLHDVAKDAQGNYRDEYMFEIINRNK